MTEPDTSAPPSLPAEAQADAEHAHQKLLGLITLSLVMVIDVATLVYAKRKLGTVMPVMPPTVILTLCAFVYAWRRLSPPRAP